METDDFDPYYEWLGIAPGEQPADHYQLLGLPRYESNPRLIENACEKQLAFLHTKRLSKQSTLAEQLKQKISAAARELLVPERKAAYDEALRAKKESASLPPAPGPWNPHATPTHLPPPVGMQPVAMQPVAMPFSGVPMGGVPIAPAFPVSEAPQVRISSPKKKKPASSSQAIPIALGSVVAIALAIVAWGVLGRDSRPKAKAPEPKAESSRASQVAKQPSESPPVRPRAASIPPRETAAAPPPAATPEPAGAPISLTIEPRDPPAAASENVAAQPFVPGAFKVWSLTSRSHSKIVFAPSGTFTQSFPNGSLYDGTWSLRQNTLELKFFNSSYGTAALELNSPDRMTGKHDRGVDGGTYDWELTREQDPGASTTSETNISNAATAQRESSERTLWRYEKGEFGIQPDGSWLQQTGDLSLRYREFVRTVEYVELEDADGSSRVRLHAGFGEIARPPTVPFKNIADGAWVTRSASTSLPQVEPELAATTPEVKPASRAPAGISSSSPEIAAVLRKLEPVKALHTKQLADAHKEMLRAFDVLIGRTEKSTTLKADEQIEFIKRLQVERAAFDKAGYWPFSLPGRTLIGEYSTRVNLADQKVYEFFEIHIKAAVKDERLGDAEHFKAERERVLAPRIVARWSDWTMFWSGKMDNRFHWEGKWSMTSKGDAIKATWKSGNNRAYIDNCKISPLGDVLDCRNQYGASFKKEWVKP